MPAKTLSQGALSRLFEEGYDRWTAIAVYIQRNDRLPFRPIWKYATPHPFTLMPQSGGEHITVNAQTFEYNEDINMEGSLIAVYGDTDGGRRHECFCIKFHMHQNGQQYAKLSSLDGRDSCLTDGSALSANILLAAVELARENGAQWIELFDASKLCKDERTPPVSLANYYFLSCGKTWYETILPFHPDDPYIIEYNRKQLMTKSWSNFVTALEYRHPVRCKNMLRDIPLSLDSIPVEKPGSIMHVIRSIPRERRFAFLYKYMDDIFIALSILSLNGMVWWLPLTPDTNRPLTYELEG